jgi:prepilin-type N-terminal cleavage/methylation domain-containing protein
MTLVAVTSISVISIPHPAASRRCNQQRVVALCSKYAKGNTGFTLIELLAVIAIVAILAALGLCRDTESDGHGQIGAKDFKFEGNWRSPLGLCSR